MSCRAGKRTYATPELAINALLEAHISFKYPPGGGPRNFYHCEDCGLYHLTSSGDTEPSLAKALADGTILRESQARVWSGKKR